MRVFSEGSTGLFRMAVVTRHQTSLITGGACTIANLKWHVCYALKGQQDGARSISVVVGPEGFKKKKTDLEVLIERTKRLP